jgi:hypothetical protein
MHELHVGPDLEPQVAGRHHTAAEELAALASQPASLPDLGPGPGTLAILRIFAAVHETSQELAVTNDVTAGAVRRVAHVLTDTDAEVQRRLEGLS